MKEQIKFYDTSALLGQVKRPEDLKGVFISTIVLSELEEIKTNPLKDDDIKANARRVTRFIKDSKCVKTELLNQRRVEAQFLRYDNYLPPKNDSYLLCEAALLAKRYEVTFYTGDYCQYLLGRQLFNRQFKCELVDERTDVVLHDGYKYITPTQEQYAALCNAGNTENIFNLAINEYAILLKEDGKPLDYTRWTGREYVQLGYSDIKSPLYGRFIPRNPEQKLYFDVLQNTEIPIVSCFATRGTGKTIVALINGLDMVEKGIYDRVLYLRNNWELKGTKDIGSLPGSQEEKIRPFLGPVIDIVGGNEMFDAMVASGKIDFMPLQFQRGRNISNTYIIVDEGQNCTTGIVQSIISRAAEGTKIVFCSDYKQIDNKMFYNDNGILSMNNKFFGNELYAQVHLRKVERSKVCQMCDLLD